MLVDPGISPYGHILNRSQSRMLRTTGSRKSLQTIVGEIVRSATKGGFRMENPRSETPSGTKFNHFQNFAHANQMFDHFVIYFLFILICFCCCTRVPGKGVIVGFSTKGANFRWIIPATIGFVEVSRVDIYVGLDLESWGSPPLQKSDLILGCINFKNHV